jgi:ubiquinone/menaquinone biosynthesis C-methylase UbiE/uncharacterized protein YbaR (Trm112 family)
MTAPLLADVLRCSKCGSTYAIGRASLSCERCGTTFPIVDGIPVLLSDETAGTTLDKLDYDALVGIDKGLIYRTGIQWRDVIVERGLPTGHALEIGSGTGALTLGLLQTEAVQRLTATDVSLEFLSRLAPKAEEYSTPASFVVCDTNEQHFRAESFDLVLGRSVLHHLLDYEDVIRQCHEMLKPGGAAVFFEPVLEGLTVTTLCMALMLRCDAEANGGLISPTDRQKIEKQIRNQMKGSLVPQDREWLATIEDKYIFEIDKLEAVGRAAGFADVEFVSGNLAFGYWAYVAHACRVVGVSPDVVRPYKWIAEEFANTFGVVFPDKMIAPVGYFVFRR